MKNPLAVLWSRPYVLFCLLLITGTCSLKAQCPAATPLVINTVTVTESRCAASGTATVAVSGGSTPYTLSIVAGPTLAPPQSSNVLQSLEPGAYTVQVTDNCNTSLRKALPSWVNRAVSIRLVGIDGKVYRNVHVAAGSTETTIDMSNLASGSYVVAFTGIDGTVAIEVWK
jgi:hypothetical protein